MTSTTRAAITPGEISPIRTVPDAIVRPHYVDLTGRTRKGPAHNRSGRKLPSDYEDPQPKSPETIAAMRVAGRIAAQALEEVGRNVVPGVTTDELDRIGHEFLLDHGAYPSTLGYKNFPKSLCTSINEVICHGIPDSTVVADGDIVKVDITAYIDGVHGDNCGSYVAGDAREEVVLLAERTREAMLRAIRSVRPGRETSVIGRVIESYAKRFGYGVVKDYTGHGVGQSFHTKPTILHYDEPRVSTPFEVGMTFTIEPMITLGGIEWEMWDDGWTVLTKDRSWVAQWENTIVVTEGGAEILTAP